MSDMVEKVARAICGHAASGFCLDVGGDLGCKRGRGESYNGSNCIATREQLVMTPHWDQARAAIEAMREPTEEMVQVGLRGPRGFPSVEARKAAEYTAMIDSALSTTALGSSGVAPSYRRDLMINADHFWSTTPGDWRHCWNCGCHHPDEHSTPEGLAPCPEPTSLRKFPYGRWVRWTENQTADFEAWCTERGAKPADVRAAAAIRYKEYLDQDVRGHAPGDVI